MIETEEREDNPMKHLAAENMKAAATEGQRAAVYFHGDAAEYTGKAEMLYGKMFYEIKMIEGHLRGELRWSPTAPKA
jgi:hypothetical protein